MKKNLFFMIVIAGTATVHAQNEGNVGINTVTPSATLHVKSIGNTATTKALRVDNDSGANLLTINSDGTVSGLAAANLSSGTPATPKAAGIFSGMTPVPADGYLSPIGNGFAPSYASSDARAFYAVAQTVPFDTVLDQMTFSLRATAVYYAPRPVTAQLYINNLPTALMFTFTGPFFNPDRPYTSLPVLGSVTVRKGDHFAYRINGFDTPEINCYVSVRYTEL